MKANDPCPFCKGESFVVESKDTNISYKFTCIRCHRSYDHDGNLVFMNTSDTISDSSECPRCGFPSGLMLTSRRFGKLKIFNCHQCDGMFKENKQRLTDEEWAHVWIHAKD